MDKGLYVQYGSGWDAPSGWLNFDASPTLRVERIPLLGKRFSAACKGNPALFPDNVQYGDIVKGLPLGKASCTGVYCSHVLEHLALDEFRRALINTKLLMRTDGIFRLVLPDLNFYIRQYCEDPSANPALQFMQATGLGEPSRKRGMRGFLQEILGNSKHLWMWDYPSLEAELKRVGFVSVRQASIGDSNDKMFKQVEREDRWINCLGIECSLNNNE